jgi:parallel beta-helix repeat protein
MRRLFLSISLALCLAPMGAAWAADIYVNGATGNDGNSGSSWSNPLGSISRALVLAASGTDIRVAAGTYFQSITMKSGVGLYGGYAGSGALRDLSAYPTTIDAMGHWCVVVIENATGARLDGFTITGGHVVSSSFPDNMGGGIYCNNAGSGVSITDCTVSGNSAVEGGNAGVCFFSSNPTLTNCAIIGNSGSGVHCHSSSPTLINCTIVGCHGNIGSGLFCRDSHPVLTNCVISGHSGVSAGGGVCLYSSNPTLSKCTISGNNAKYAGGGLYCSESNPTLTNCIISGNWAGVSLPTGPVGNHTHGEGGGLSCSYSNPTLTNCTIASNSTNYIGGGFNLWHSSPTITNTIFSGNNTYAIIESTASDDSDPVVQNCLFHNNPDGDYRDERGRRYTGASAINSIVTGGNNVDGDPMFVMGAMGKWSLSPNYHSASNTTTLTDSLALFTPGALVGRLISGNTSHSTQALIISNTTTTIKVAGDTTDWMQSGGAYRLIDYHLGYHSAAIDAGTGEGAPATDIEGATRPIDIPGHGADLTYDIGAYEAQAIRRISVTAISHPLDFSSHFIDAGPSAPQVVVIANVGFDTLNFTGNGIEITGVDASEFHITSTIDTSPLPVGASRAVQIVFDPSTVANKSAYVTVTTNDANDPTINLLLLGQGTLPTLYVDCDVPASGDGSSWSKAKKTIAEGFIAAGSGTELHVAEGTYLESITMKSGVTLYGGYNGISGAARDIATWPTAIDGINIGVLFSDVTGAHIDGFIIKRNSTGIECLNSVDDSTIVNCTITGNRTQGVKCSGDAGPIFTNCAIVDNSGWGVVCENESYPTLINCTISGNSTSKDGGGVYCHSESRPIFASCLISNNHADRSGGGLFCMLADPTLINCVISDNSSDNDGGGIYAYEWAHVTLTDSTITHNYARGGGGLYINHYASSILTNCIISDNFSEFSGGGVHCNSNTNTTLTNCTISGNSTSGYDPGGSASPPKGGGIHYRNGAFSSLINCVISGNSSVLGGGVSIGIAGSATLTNCTINDNAANYGGGVHCDYISETTITNTIFSNNTNYAVFEGSSSHSDAKMSFCLFHDNPDGDYFDEGYKGYTGAAAVNSIAEAHHNIDGDPMFQGASDYHLGYGSAAIDVCTSIGAPTTDIEGATRPIDIPGHGSNLIYDVGAYEAQANAPSEIRVLANDGQLNFGKTSIGAGPSAPQQVIISNRGFANLNFTGNGIEIIGVQAGEFLTTNIIETSPLPPGASCTVEVAFDPSTLGSKSASLAITTDDVDEPISSVDLLGEGAPSTLYTDCDVQTSGDGSTWTEAKKSIDEALLAAGYGTEVLIAEGTYTQTLTMKSGVRLYGGYNGITGSGAVRDIAACPTIIDASAVGHAVVIDGVIGIRLDGFTITGGYAEHGGGILCNHADDSNTVANCTISGNAADMGGGISCTYSSPALSNCTISSNSAASYRGGGINLFLSNPTLADCTISGNVGSGVYCNTSSPTLTTCRISDNSSSGVYCGANSNAKLTGCTLSGNSAIRGGGISFRDSDPTLINCIISRNFASIGGAVDCGFNTSPTLTNCTISDNAAGYAGGVYCGNNSTPSIINTIFSDNTNYAIYDADDEHNPSVHYCLFHNNSGGDYYDESSGEINPITQVNHNLSGDPMFIGDGNQVVDYHLGYGSAAIDMGSAKNAPGTDIEGTTRLIDIPGHGVQLTIDIGAYEAQMLPEINVIATSGALNFGSLCIDAGASASREVIIANMGFANLNFIGEAVATTGNNASEFIFTAPLDFSPLLPGANRAVELAFDPTTPGNKLAYLMITSDDADKPSISLAVTGIGISATQDWDIAPRNAPDGHIDILDLLMLTDMIRSGSMEKRTLLDFAKHWQER